MFLDDRKKSILHAIIDDYINTAEPIGSRTLARKHELGLSSATIRNEMADLEEMGYLTQPHTSAGRIPSDKGYRFYVDQLMKSRELTVEEIYSIKDAMETRINELSQLLKQASVVMSQITKYASMAATPGKQNSVLKAVQVVPVEKGKALIVVITNAGIIKNSLINIPETVLPEHLITVSNIFNEKLRELTIDKINLPVIREIEFLLGHTSDILLPILNGVTDCINQIDCPEVYLDGTINMLNYPEFNDVVRAKEFLNLMDAKNILGKVLNNVYKDGDYITITIGGENKVVEMRDCSLITTTYNMGNVVIGTIGVIGPTRMEYSRVLAAMNYMRERVNEEIKKLIGEDLKMSRRD
ncbi:heat-inducible transcriptional repressor HrcA [Herbivorax sp. ANBcel31]|uniref:heat-inducible transcriptional repressor HrcA n=1 Tax=Herbivorax sp. ANBcel31 TaxID=3069754 RepID=UPI0027B7D90A|nr:heat-inducible transcriptional repressor HrcA [Herbivorax sp. ANBcel31]MDQ2084986.1 heat-inducible transcriptional repressor HrcA [Herbivorax sp. ANBcel31]